MKDLIKKPEDIQAMTKGGKILADVLFEVLGHVKPGITEKELDIMADDLIVAKGGRPGFKMVYGYKYATCISTNDVVVHGIPTDYALQEGDIIGIDCGVFYKGFHTDMSQTILVETRSTKSLSRDEIQRSRKIRKYDEIRKFLAIGKRALKEAIRVAKPGNRVGHISKTIQDIVEKEAGYSIVRTLIGHGVGRDLHEPPEIPGFLRGTIEDTPLLREGMTIAIEIIYNMGGKEIMYANKDGWTIKTKDGSLSGVFERTVAITNLGSVVLTT